VACHHVEVIVSMQHGHVRADGDGGDKAIDELPDRLPFSPTMTIDASRLVIVRGFSGKDGRSCQKSMEPNQMPFVACTRQDLHSDWVAGGHVFREQFIDSIADG
jgi:hypothetical protein